MMKVMNRASFKRCAKVLTIAAMLAMPATPALARSNEPDREVVDARLEGYSTNVSLPPGSSGLTWVTLVVLGVICCGGLFKDAKRSHLD